MRATLSLLALATAALVCVVAPAAAEAPITGIVFTSNHCIREPDCSPGYQVYRVQADGTMRRLTNVECGTTGAAWAPDGATIFFARNLRGATSGRNCAARNIWAMAPDGSGLRAITTGDEIDDAPDVSPDGTLLAFDSSRGATARTKRDIYVANADGSGLRRLTTYPGHDAGPRFTADGRTLIFSRSPGNEDQRFRGDPVDLWSVPVAGGPERQLTAGGGFLGGFPAPSPDGTAVAFSDRGHVYVLNLVTGTLREVVVHPPGTYDVEPAWSPDGRELIFGRTISAGVAEEGTDLYRVPAAGGDADRIVTASGGGVQVRWADWWGPGRPSAAPRTDRVPPVTLLGTTTAAAGAAVRLTDTTAIGRPARAAAAAARRSLSAKAGDLAFLTLDRSGVRRVEVAFVRRGHAAAPRYHRVADARALRRLAAGLPSATYKVYFRATDGRGNRTKRPAPATLRLRH